MEIEHYQFEEYLNTIRPYLKDITNNLKKSDTWKIQLAIANNFISSTDNGEKRVMHSKSDNIEIVMNDKADEIIEELFDSLKNRYQNNLELMKGSEFVFNYEKNNVTIALNVLYAKKEKIYPAYVSKHNSNRVKQVILLMISNEEIRKAKSEIRQ